MSPDPVTTGKVQFERSNYGCLGVVVFCLAIPVYIIFLRVAAPIYYILKNDYSFSIGLVIGLGWYLGPSLLLLWIFIYLIGKEFTDIPIAMYLDSQGIWTERFYQKKSSLFKWEDIVDIKERDADTYIDYCNGYRYFYQIQMYEFEIWQRQNYYRPNRQIISQCVLPKTMLGYDKHEWLSLVKNYFDHYGQTATNGSDAKLN